MKRKIAFVFGTRPEAIKLAPLIKKFKKEKNKFQVFVISTGQHREMLNQVIDFFEIKKDYDLNLMKKNQNLHTLTSNIIEKLSLVFNEINPNMVFVHGDTTTTLSASLSAFYLKIPICHVEAGLRTFDKYSPFPEEINRQITGILANFHFAPTKKAAENLKKLGVDNNKIFITGNTVIDALKLGLSKIKKTPKIISKDLNKLLSSEKKMILITIHRRENHGKNIENIFNNLKLISEKIKNVRLIFPVHLNPNVLLPAKKILSKSRNIFLIDPLSYQNFIFLMSKSHLIITDSGGIQEEAPTLKVPILVLRDSTERPEAIDSGVAKLISASGKVLFDEVFDIINDKKKYSEYLESPNPYGDGTACEKIFQIIK